MSALLILVTSAGSATDAEDAAVRLAREELARELQVAADGLALQETRAVEWPDGSLGCPERGMRYPPVVTPGYEVFFEDEEGRRHEVHVGAGRAVVCGRPARQRKARRVDVGAANDASNRATGELAKRLEIGADEIRVERLRPVTWPDASLGCPEPDRLYAQVRASGYEVRLEAPGGLFVYHVAGVRVIDCTPPPAQRKDGGAEAPPP